MIQHQRRSNMDINLSKQPPIEIDFGVKVVDVARGISYVRFEVDDNMNLIVHRMDSESAMGLGFQVDDNGNLIISK